MGSARLSVVLIVNLTADGERSFTYLVHLPVPIPNTHCLMSICAAKCGEY